MFDTWWVAAPVEPSPSWDATVPGLVEDGFGWAFDAELPGPPELPPEWDEDLDGPLGFPDDHDLDLAADADPGGDGDGGRWAVPGVAEACAAGGVSRATAVVLGEVSASWVALRRAQARCYRALTGLEASGAVGETGYRSTSRLLSDHVRIDPSEAARLARQARALAGSVSPTGTTVPADLPATAGEVDGGVIGPGHVEVIRTTMRRLNAVTPAIPAQVLVTTEAELAGLATTRSPAGLADAAQTVLALLDPDGTAPEDQPLPDNELHYLRRRNGNLVGRFTYRDPAAAEALHTALTVATPPADPTPDPAPDEPRGEAFGTQAARTLPGRRAQALLDLAAEALTRGLNTDDAHPEGTGEDTGTLALFPDDPTPDNETDEGDGACDGHTAHDDDEARDDEARDTASADDSTAPGTAAGASAGEPAVGVGPGAGGPPAWRRADLEGGERVALTVTLNYDTLRRAVADTDPAGFTGRLALLGENTWVRPETARRLACDAEIIPAVLGARGEVLDLGRKMRIVPLALRRAVILRDRHCAHPGCRRRARRCQVHHIQHWIDDGETCLENCVLLCAYHHQVIHHSGWEVHMIDGLPWFTPPAWLDPLRRPRHNRPWQPAHQQAA